MLGTRRLHWGSIVAAATLAVQVGAQTPTVAVAGRVTDSNGKPIPGVAVSLGGQALKAPLTVTTGSDGSYRFPATAGSAYTLSFRRNGFTPVNRADAVASGGAELRVDQVMTPAASANVVDMAFATRSGTDRLGADAVLVRVQTGLGDIDMLVDLKRAPVTAANFLKYVDAGLYDGGRFNRATRPDNYNTAPPDRPMMELIQGGLSPDKKGQAFPPIPLERTTVTGIRHIRGVVSMARGEADTATSEFFILLDDQPSLDMGGRRFPDHQGAAAFGHVLAGLDVVAKIQQQPVQAQNLSPPVAIVSVKRLPR